MGDRIIYTSGPIIDPEETEVLTPRKPVLFWQRVKLCLTVFRLIMAGKIRQV